MTDDFIGYDADQWVEKILSYVQLYSDHSQTKIIAERIQNNRENLSNVNGFSKLDILTTPNSTTEESKN